MAFKCLSLYLSAQLALSSVVNANPLPVEDSLIEDSRKATIVERADSSPLYGFYGCNGDQKAKISKAFEDAVRIVREGVVTENINWNSKMVKDYFGADAKDEKDTIIGSGLARFRLYLY